MRWRLRGRDSKAARVFFAGVLAPSVRFWGKACRRGCTIGSLAGSSRDSPHRIIQQMHAFPTLFVELFISHQHTLTGPRRDAGSDGPVYDC